MAKARVGPCKIGCLMRRVLAEGGLALEYPNVVLIPAHKVTKRVYSWFRLDGLRIVVEDETRSSLCELHDGLLSRNGAPLLTGLATSRSKHVDYRASLTQLFVGDRFDLVILLISDAFVAFAHQRPYGRPLPHSGCISTDKALIGSVISVLLFVRTFLVAH